MHPSRPHVVQVIVLALFFSLTPLYGVYAQVSTPGTPISYGATQQSNVRQVPFKIRKADVKRRMNNTVEEARARQQADSLQNPVKAFGKSIAVTIDVLQEAALNILPDGGKLYLLKMGSADAYGLQLHFSKFKLPVGANLYVYNPDRSMKLGAYTKVNNNPSNEFAIQVIKGDSLIVEYYEPGVVEFKSEVTINRVIHAFSPIFTGQGGTTRSGFGASGACNINITCEPIYADEAKGVARIITYDPATGLSSFVSGSLINSVSQKAYLLTANHAYYGSMTAGHYFSSWIFYFNYEHPSCTNSTLEPDNSKTYQGAYVRSRGGLSDYMLLEFSVNPKSRYAVNYLGWDATGAMPNAGVYCIHHPDGDVKKVALAYSAPPLTVKTQTRADNPRRFDEVQGLPYTDFKLHWDEGVTEAGSSGAPLLNMQSKRIVGQLHGGNSGCSTGGDITGPDYFGMLATSWQNPDAGYPTLKSLLAGSSSTVTELNGDYNGGPGSQPYVIIREITLSTNAFELPKNKLIPTIETYGNTGTLSYEWTPTSDFSYPTLRDGVITFRDVPPTLPLTRTYTLKVTPEFGTGATKSVTVTLYDCQNRTFSKNIALNTDVQLGRPGTAGETYAWSPAINLSNAAIANPIFKSAAAGGFSYTMTATSAGCTRTERYGLYVEMPGTPVSLITEITSQKVLYTSSGYVGTSYELPFAIRLTDGSYVVSTSYAAPYDTDSQVELIKLDASFNVVMRKRFETSFLNRARAIKEASDGGFVLTGEKLTFNSYGESNPAIAKVIKFDANLNAGWTYEKRELFKPDENRKLVSDENFVFEAISQTQDGGYVMIEYNRNYNDYPTPWGLQQYRNLVKLSTNGTFESSYQLAYASYLTTYFYPRQLTDGSYVVATNDGTIMKFSFSTGFTKVWTKSLFDGVNKNNFGDIVTLPDNTFAVAYGVNSSNGSEFRIVKMNPAGDIVWDRRYGGSGHDKPTTLAALSTGGFMVGGFSDSPASGHKSGYSRGDDDYWTVKLDANGVNIGDNTYGGSGFDMLKNVFELSPGVYTLLGSSSSPVSGEKTIPLGAPDTQSIWWLQIREGGCSTPAATITYSGGSYLCRDQSATLTANSGDLIYRWHKGGVLIGETQSITVAGTDPGTYSLTIMKPNSCATTTSINVFAYSVKILSPTPFCAAGGSTTLTAASAFPLVMAPPTHRWQRSSGGSWVDASTSTASSISVNTVGTYRVIATMAGCSFTSPEVAVTSISSPKPSISASGNVCTSGSQTLTASSGSSYSWSTGETSQSIDGAEGGSYYVRVTYSNGCSNISFAYSVPLCERPCPRPPCSGPILPRMPLTDITVSPNPSDAEVTIYLPEGVEASTPMRMYSQIGTMVNVSVARPGANSVTIDTRELVDGVYILQIALKGNRSVSKKILVAHQ